MRETCLCSCKFYKNEKSRRIARVCLQHKQQYTDREGLLNYTLMREIQGIQQNQPGFNFFLYPEQPWN